MEVLAHTTTAAHTTYAEILAPSKNDAQTGPQDSQLIQLLTEQTTLLRNLASQTIQPSLTELLTSQTQLLNSIVKQNNEILQALRDLATANHNMTTKLSIVAHNCHGIKNFVNNITTYPHPHILFLCETWSVNNSWLPTALSKSYNHIQVPACITPGRGRPSGGLILLTERCLTTRVIHTSR